MDAKEMQKYRKILLAKQKEISTTLSALEESTKPVELDQSTIGRLGRMDAMQSQAVAIESARRLEIEMQKIGVALERIEQGVYGECIGCGKEIGTSRLDALPQTSLCIKCATPKKRP